MRLTSYKIFEYTFLVFGALTFVSLYWVFRSDYHSKVLITALGALFYVIWGIFHHQMEKRLNLQIALEYILMAVFVFLLVFTALSIG